jgi:hypothetical protein
MEKIRFLMGLLGLHEATEIEYTLDGEKKLRHVVIA